MRYDRNHVLEHIGHAGQDQLSDSHATVVGLGSTGSLTAELLVRNGVNLTILDHDVVDTSNLTRQLLYTTDDVGDLKADVAATVLRRINPEVTVTAHTTNLTAGNVDVLDADVILDCTDNLHTRFVINDYAVKHETPWVYAAAVEDRGMVYVTDGAPCYSCIFNNEALGHRCEDVGILNSAATRLSSIQVTEAIKLLLDHDHAEGLLTVDAWNHNIDELTVTPEPGCPTCNGDYAYLDPNDAYRIWYCNAEDALCAQATTVFEADEAMQMTIDGENITIKPHGEIVFSSDTNKDTARAIAAKVFQHSN
jgi:adenylyltransferase/sulfurtransferase